MKKVGVILLILSIFLFNSYAENQTPNNVIKVGWFQSANFQEGMSDDSEKSGYCYEYLQRISDYTGWEYEYVYGEWAELYEKLVKCEIDVLGGVSFTEERGKYINFPNYAIGSDNYYLFQHSDKQTINAKNPDSFEGKKIGCIKNNRMTVFLEEWLKKINAKPILVYYDGFTERDKDFNSNKIDALTATDYNVTSVNNYSPVVKIGEEPFFLAVNKNRTDILMELNSVHSFIVQLSPSFLETLQYKSYGKTLANSNLSLEENDWLSRHYVLKVGYIKDYMPFCGEDSNGNVTGIIKELVSQIGEGMHLTNRIKIQYVGFNSFKEMGESLRDEIIDISFPVISERKYINEMGIKGSTDVITVPFNVAYTGNYSDATFDRIALNSRPISLIKEQYPNSTIINKTSGDDCLKAIITGEASCTIIASYRLNQLLNNPKYRQIKTMPVSANITYCIGVNKNDKALLSIINKGLAFVDKPVITDSVFKYIQAGAKYTTLDFIKDNIVPAIIISVIIISVLLLSVFLYYVGTYKSRIEIKNKQIQLEKALVAAEVANEAKTSFLFNMSHDIRTPMNAIMGFTTLLEKYQDDPRKRNDYLKKISDSSAVLLSIINNVLEMSRIEKGTLVLEETVWSITQFLDTISSVFNEMMEQKGIEFVRNINVKSEYVYCDPTKLRSIFINIISNSYKYTNAGGKITISLDELPYYKEDWKLFRATITDTGIGISEDFLPHIFDEFSRENNTTENKIEGTGLGLSIVNNLVKLMNGTIEVESEQGVGTTFVVSIPHRIAHNLRTENKAQINIDNNKFNNRRVLVTEDNDLNAEIAAEILKEAGFNPERAVNGLECLTKIENAEPGFYDIVLMDIQMPVMNGYEAARLIRALPDQEKASIPILAMTANAFEEDKREAMRAGMNGHLAKPLNVQEMINMIISALE